MTKLQVLKSAGGIPSIPGPEFIYKVLMQLKTSVIVISMLEIFRSILLSYFKSPFSKSSIE